MSQVSVTNINMILHIVFKLYVDLKTGRKTTMRKHWQGGSSSTRFRHCISFASKHHAAPV